MGVVDIPLLFRYNVCVSSFMKLVVLLCEVFHIMLGITLLLLSK